MAGYFMGVGGGGFGGNTATGIGQIGPAWQKSFLDGLRVYDALYDMQNRVEMDKWQLPASAAQQDAAFQKAVGDAIFNNQRAQALDFAQSSYDVRDQLRRGQEMGFPFNAQQYEEQQQKVWGKDGGQRAMYNPATVAAPAQPSAPVQQGFFASSAPQFTLPVMDTAAPLSLVQPTFRTPNAQAVQQSYNQPVQYLW